MRGPGFSPCLVPAFLCGVGCRVVPTFIPPSVNNVAAAPVQGEGVAWRLFRYAEAGKSADNVYRLVDGSFVTVPPVDEAQISRVFFGASENYVTDAEADELVAAGFTVSAGVFELGSKYSSTLGGDAKLGEIEGGTV